MNQARDSPRCSDSLGCPDTAVRALTKKADGWVNRRRAPPRVQTVLPGDRKSTRLNSRHVRISYAVFCLKKKEAPSSPIQRVAAYPGRRFRLLFVFFNDTATTEIYTLSLHDALPNSRPSFQ